MCIFKDHMSSGSVLHRKLRKYSGGFVDQSMLVVDFNHKKVIHLGILAKGHGETRCYPHLYTCASDWYWEYSSRNWSPYHLPVSLWVQHNVVGREISVHHLHISVQEIQGLCYLHQPIPDLDRVQPVLLGMEWTPINTNPWKMAPLIRTPLCYLHHAS